MLLHVHCCALQQNKTKQTKQINKISETHETITFIQGGYSIMPHYLCRSQYEIWLMALFEF